MEKGESNELDDVTKDVDVVLEECVNEYEPSSNENEEPLMAFTTSTTSQVLKTPYMHPPHVCPFVVEMIPPHTHTL